jgi:hypothetical protein
VGNGAVDVLEIVGPRAADDDLIVQNPETFMSRTVRTVRLGTKWPNIHYPIVLFFAG